MDAFYASVEKFDDPELIGKPVLVGGSGPRGVVAAASYEARWFGARSAMPMRRALSLCPDAVVVRPRMARYREVSKKIFEIFHALTPDVEGLSLDEAFLDVSANTRLHGSPRDIALRIKKQIRDDTGLTASVGIGPNKLVAKIASELEKPDGLVELDPDTIRDTLDPLPISALFGVGPKTAERLHAVSIETFRDLRLADDAALVPIFGRYAKRIRARAAGIDHRPVGGEAEDKSVSAEETFDTDIGDPDRLRGYLLSMTAGVADKIRRKNWVASQVGIKLRLPDFTTLTRQRRFHPPTNSCIELQKQAMRLLELWIKENQDAELRLLGVAVHGLSPDTQMNLFDDETPGRSGRVDEVLGEVQDRFGDAALQRGRGKPG